MKIKTIIVIMTFISLFADGFSQTLYVPDGSIGVGKSLNTNIGIGTSSPIAKFDVRGNIYIPNGYSYNIGSISDYGNRLRLSNNGTNAYIDYYQNLFFRSGSSNSSINMILTSNGNIGLGTTTPAARLAIESTSGLMGLYINHQSSADYTWGMKINVNRDLTKALIISNALSGKDVMLVYGNGQIYGNGFNVTSGGCFSVSNIGDWALGYSAAATGDFAKAFTLKDKNGKEAFTVFGSGVVNAKKIYAEAFEVRPDAFNIYWFDNVFSSKYKLKPIKELDMYIQKNRHLPDIPSEKDVKENGFNMAQMDGLLLKKIEELTLYILQQQKEIDQLKEKLSVINN